MDTYVCPKHNEELTVGTACPGCIAEAVKKPAPATDVDAVLAERGKRYGKFKDHAQVTQDLKLVVFRHMEKVGKSMPDADQMEALEMILHKIGRIANGDSNYVDNWVDIAGYAKLVADRLEGVER